MKFPVWFAFILAFTSAIPAWSMDGSVPAARVACVDDLETKPKLNLAAAHLIIGEASKQLSPRTQISRASNYVLSLGNVSFAHKTEDLGMLFEAIQQSQGKLKEGIWLFKRITGPDDSVGYFGTAGHFFLVRPDGKMYRGLLDVDNAVDQAGKWNGSFDYLYPVLPDPAKLTMEEAFEIVGQSELMNAGPQLGKTIKYMLNINRTGFDYQVRTLDTLLEAISQSHFNLWKHQRFIAPDGSVGFSGDRMNPDSTEPERSFILLTQSGQLFKGKLDIRTVDSQGNWNGKAVTMDLQKPVKP